MKEQDLIKLGFERTDVNKEESGDEDFHYYTYDFGLSRSISLITSANTDVDEYWSVEIFEDEGIVFYDLEDVTNLIKIIKKGIVR
jgi:hypothetical protein